MSSLLLGPSPQISHAHLPYTHGSATAPDYANFESDYCSNFSCCGLASLDMHGLLAHIDEVHGGEGYGSSFFPSSSAFNVNMGLDYSYMGMEMPLVDVDEKLARYQASMDFENAKFDAAEVNGENSESVGESDADAPSPHSSTGPQTPPPMYDLPHQQQQIQTPMPIAVPTLPFIPPTQSRVQVVPQLPQLSCYTASASPSPASSPYPCTPFSANSPNTSYKPFVSVTPGEVHAHSPLSGVIGSMDVEKKDDSMNMNMDVFVGGFDTEFSEESYNMDSSSSAPNMVSNSAPLTIAIPTLGPIGISLNSSLVHTPLDSTPPSPLAASIRPSVLRGAALMADAPSRGLPPSLFCAPMSSASSPISCEASSSSLKKRKDSGNSGGVVRREKSRRTIGPLGSRTSADDEELSPEELERLREEKERRRKEERRERDRERREREREAREREKERIAQELAAAAASSSGSSPGSTPPADIPSSSSGGKKVREKAYKCTKSGCTKSYLNPNGLKYHLAKGTCTFAVSSESADGGSSDGNVSTSGANTPMPGTPSLMSEVPVSLADMNAVAAMAIAKSASFNVGSPASMSACGTAPSTPVSGSPLSHSLPMTAPVNNGLGNFAGYTPIQPAPVSGTGAHPILPASQNRSLSRSSSFTNKAQMSSENQVSLQISHVQQIQGYTAIQPYPTAPNLRAGRGW